MDMRVLGHSDPDRTGTVLDDGPARAAAALTGKAMLSYARGEERTLEAAVPASLGPKRLGTARILFSRRAVEERLRQGFAAARRRILMASMPFLLAGFGGAFLVTALVLKPFGTLVSGVRRIGQGNLGHRIPLSGRDEVSWLAGEVNRMGEKLGELDGLKQDFVNSVTHDLKSPLASIRIAADVLQEETESLLGSSRPSQRLADSYLHIREASDRLSLLITALLDVARIESALALDRRPARLEDLAEGVVRAFELVARRKGIDLSLQLESDLPPLPVDAAKVERVLSNLVSNAVKFTEKGGVRVRLFDDGPFQAACVEDTGPGIPPGAREKLFSKFFRVRRPGEKLEGTGLGLAIVKGFVEAHGGSVSVEDVPGGGAAFTVRLPKGV
jgi:signal transduction histidine kinase